LVANSERVPTKPTEHLHLVVIIDANVTLSVNLM
jgi:hypothetical protein